MKYNKKKINVLIYFLAKDNDLGFCPSECKLKDDKHNCDGSKCILCWEKALTGDD